MVIKQGISPLILVVCASVSVVAGAANRHHEGYQAGFDAAFNGQPNQVVVDKESARLASLEKEQKYTENYQQGYAKGLAEFCTPENAREWGKTAYAYTGACDQTTEKLRFYRNLTDVKWVSIQRN